MQTYKVAEIKDLPLTALAKIQDEYRKLTFLVSENKASISSWITFWPASIFWTTCHEPIIRIVRSLRTTYDKVEAAALAPITKQKAIVSAAYTAKTEADADKREAVAKSFKDAF